MQKMRPSSNRICASLGNFLLAIGCCSWNVRSDLHVSGSVLQCGCWKKRIPNNRPRNCLFQPSLYDSKAIQCECLRSPSIVNIFLSHFPASLSSISCFNDQFKVVILSAPKTLFNRRSSEISNVAWRSRSFSYFCFGAFFRESIFGDSRRVSTEAVGKVYAKV